MKERVPESAGDEAFALLLPGLSYDVRARVVREWAEEQVRPAYARRGLPPPRWVQREGTNPEEFRALRQAEKIWSMGTSEGELSALRAAVTSRSTHTSQQRVAKQVGVNAATLHHFRRGRVPSENTLAQLERWYRHAVLAGEVELAGEPGAVLLVKPFLLAVPCAGRGPAALELMAGIRRFHVTRGLPVPEWMDAATRWRVGDGSRGGA